MDLFRFKSSVQPLSTYGEDAHSCVGVDVGEIVGLCVHYLILK